MLALGAVGVAQAQDAFTLRRIFKMGETMTYNMAMTSETTVDISAFGQGEQKTTFTQSGKISFKTTKVDEAKKEANLEIKYFDIDMKMEGGMPGMGGDMPKEYSVMATMDSMNRIKDMKIEGMPGMLRMMSESSMRQSLGGVQFPEAAVKVGDGWDVKVPKDGMMFDTDQVLKAKFLSVKDINGKKAYEISVKGPLNLNMDLSKMMEQGGGDNPMAGMKMAITGKMDNDSVVTIDAETGNFLIIDMKMTQEMTVDMVDMGVKLPMFGNTTSIIKASTIK
ncbi:MAG: hypothetical protein JNJ45_02450 [Chthonomonas sp.]|nr:hypothetical protein [Chthonomonas sp.]